MRARSLFASGTLVLLCGCGGSDSSTTPAPTDSSASDTSGTDGTSTDTGSGGDTSVSDSSGTDGTDSGGGDDTSGDGGPQCKGSSTGPCSGGLSCLCCPAGGPTNNCVCSTKCKAATDCTDPARPKCNQSAPGAEGICTSTDFKCAWGAVSSRRFKEDIAYADDAELSRLATQAHSLKLATYRYKGAPAGDRHLGYILEDAPTAASSDLAHSQVDLYAYTSMAMAALQVQNKRIEALEREIAQLRLTCGGK